MRTDFINEKGEKSEIETVDTEKGVRAVQTINGKFEQSEILNVMSEIEFHTTIREGLKSVGIELLETSTDVK